MKATSRFLAGMILAIAAALPALASEDLVRYEVSTEDLESRVGTYWYGLYMQKKKVGYVKMQFLSRGEGTDRVWISRFDGLMKIMAMGKKTDVRIGGEQVFDGEAPFALKAGSNSQSIMGSVHSVKVERAGSELIVTVSGGGETYSRKVPLLDYTVADDMCTELWVRRNPKKGDTIRHRSLEIDDLTIDVETKEVLGVMESMVEGVKTRVFEIKATSKKEGDIGTSRVTADGVLLSIVLGKQIEARLEPEILAKKISYSGDLFVFGMAKLDRPLGIAPKSVRTLVLEVDGEGASKVPNRARQSLEKEGGKFILRLGDGVGGSKEASEEEIGENLKETSNYPIHHDIIVKLRDEALGTASTDREKVSKLIHFTEDFIRDALAADKPSIFAIIKKRKGDCSEHAHLFCALARAAGIPAREVGGLAYMGDKIQAFGGHAWCEVVLDGKWVPVDPTWGEVLADATHVSFGDQGGTEFFALLGGLRFKVISVNGRAVRGGR
ncbi:MAG: transglutaminase-like domain-containing protein [Planctomycetota bacterium]|jgi:hypothetical protein